MTFRYRNTAALILMITLLGGGQAIAAEGFHGSFAEPVDGGNLDVERSSFDGTLAHLVPRWHESEALGGGAGARRWRNMLFALRGVRGRIVTFRLPARPAETGVRFHDVDESTVGLIHPVWSYGGGSSQWSPFEEVESVRPVPASHPAGNDSATGPGEAIAAAAFGADEYGWVFRNAVPFTEDVVYVSINEHFPVLEFYGWLEANVLRHDWVRPTASEAVPGTCLIGYQSGGVSVDGAYSREVPDMPLYGFQIADPVADPRKVVMLVSGQHPYEGQTKAALQAAIEWILDPVDPAAAAYRAEYVTLVYPFVNPTGELAGLWRGTAYDVRRDVNRHWDTELTDPAHDRGIDTVIVHKQAMLRDVAAIGLGQPYAVVDLHQTFGDRMPSLHYVMHDTSPAASAFVRRLQEEAEMADVVSAPSRRTLRGFWQRAGAGMALCVERAASSTLAEERSFGRQLMRAFAPGEEDAAEFLAASPSAVEADASEVAAAVAESGPEDALLRRERPAEHDCDHFPPANSPRGDVPAKNG